MAVKCHIQRAKELAARAKIRFHLQLTSDFVISVGVLKA
jgi:hypothetical protein